MTGSKVFVPLNFFVLVLGCEQQQEQRSEIPRGHDAIRNCNASIDIVNTQLRFSGGHRI